MAIAPTTGGTFDGISPDCLVVSERKAVRNGAWWTYVSIAMMMLVAGSLYSFGLWNKVLKESGGMGYALSQSQMELLGTMAHLGNYVTMDAGLLNDRCGIDVTLAYACVLCFLGYTGLWLSVNFGEGGVPLPVLAIFCLLYGHGCGCISNSGMTATVRYFPAHKGSAVGCMKGYFGMSGAVVSIFYYAMFSPDLSGFLLFLGLYSLVMCLVFFPVIRSTQEVVKESHAQVASKFRYLMLGIFAFLMVFLALNINKSKITDRTVWLMVMVVSLAGIASLFLLVRSSGATADVEATTAVAGNGAARLEEGISGFGMFVSVDFWLLAVTLMVVQGSGLLWINNAPQIAEALQGETSDTTAYVATISCFNGLGRLLFGNASEYTLKYMSRVWYFLASTCIFIFAYVLGATAGGPAVWPAGCLAGFAYGGLWGVQPALIPEIFGPRDYGFKYACLQLPNFFGSLIFATFIAGRVYDAEADADGMCFQRSCYTLTFWITALSCAVSVVLLLWFIRRTNGTYERIRAELSARGD